MNDKEIEFQKLTKVLQKDKSKLTKVLQKDKSKLTKVLPCGCKDEEIEFQKLTKVLQKDKSKLTIVLPCGCKETLYKHELGFRVKERLYCQECLKKLEN